MTTEEGPAVEVVDKVELLTNGDAGKMEKGILKTTESSTLLTVKPEVQSVNDLEVAIESNNSSVKLDSATPRDVKVEAVEDMKEERKGGEAKVVANGNSGARLEENGEDHALSSENAGVTILPHWNAKPCVHITGLGGVVTEEDLVPLLTAHGQIGCIVFENDRKDSAIVRYESSGAESEDVVARVCESINNKQIKGKTLVAEPFCPDSLLFIGNLTPEIDDGVLRQMFEPHGTVERAFVLRNISGRSKGYGFVEYSLKSQATAAKVAMGNINMDGRVLRVEWSDCRKISDMFSTVLFVDRISKDSTHNEQSLRNIFGKFGRVRDCHLAIGMNQQLRGFAFIDYYHSTFADKAREALDGKDVEGSNIGVRFANPSKLTQSYKTEFGTQAVVQGTSNHGRTFRDHGGGGGQHWQGVIMGKKSKKGRLANKIGAGSRSSPSTTSSSTLSPSENCHMVEIGATVDTGGCPHGPNLEKLRTQLAKLTGINCLDCTKLRSGVSVGKERKGKGKVARKKLQSPSFDGKSSTQKFWMCLSCGHVGCGGGNPRPLNSNSGIELSKQEAKQGIVGWGHAWQHWLQLKHPMVMLCGEEFSCWCFLCEHEVVHDHGVPLEAEHPSSVDGEDEASTLPSRALLLWQSAKLIREKMAAQHVDVRDGAQEPTIRLKEMETPPSLIEFGNGVEQEPKAPSDKRVMKGLINLGNTCFFNSVMQNLLGVELLRNHFGLESSIPEGALTTSLRKFFREASAQSPPETNGPSDIGVKKSGKARGGWSSIDGTYNPKGLFAAICAKAPRFKGFQQQDSHELLRCLLDGLHTEEESARKSSSKSMTSGGEDALRALSETEACENGSTVLADDLEDSGGSHEYIQITSEEDVAELKTPARIETFVDQVFGGQLSSTVSCCECGHSSVVYESFLDLSLPIPSKEPSKKVSALENGSSVALSKSQRVQALRTSKASGKTVPDLAVSRPVPVGLGTPLLLLPPPPPKDKNGDYINAPIRPDSGGDVGTGSGDANWLNFVDVGDTGRDVDFEAIFGCSPNPESQIAPLEGNGILSPPSDVSQCLIEFEQNGNFGGEVFSIADGSADPSLDVPFCEKFLLLETAPEAISKAKNSSRACGTGLRPIMGQETDVQVQMRGGSEIESFGSTLDTKLNHCPVVEHVIDTSASAEQSGDCNDNTGLQSDIINTPNGTVILLGPPVDSELPGTYSDLDVEGEYDGVGSLFEEEDNNEGKMYGSLPLNHHGGELEESTYDEVIFDDVLDLSKVSSVGRGDWLVSNEERQGEENDEASMSIEGCLQIFTRSERLSGENAWACENCSGKTLKMKKLSQKAPGEQEKVIKQDATKQFLISRAPLVLTIQLKRFAQDMRGRLSKLSTHIAFTEWLDLKPFVDHRYVTGDCKYRLIGTVEHSGTLKSGHYVAFVRGPSAPSTTGLKDDGQDTLGGTSSWYYISDSHVHQTNLEAVLQSEAYLVFYERVDNAWCVPS